MNAIIVNKMTKICDNLPYQLRVKILAGIVHRSTIKSMSSNSSKTDPFSLKFGKYPFPHAEVSAIKQFLNLYDSSILSECTLYVIRRKLSGPSGVSIYGNARPCNGCMSAIRQYNIRSIIYSTDAGSFTKESQYFFNDYK